MAFKKKIQPFMMGHIIQWVLSAEDILLYAPSLYTIKDETAFESYLMEEVLPKCIDKRLQDMYIIDVREEQAGYYSLMGYHKEFDAQPRAYGYNKEGKSGYFPPMMTIEFDEGTEDAND